MNNERLHQEPFPSIELPALNESALRTVRQYENLPIAGHAVRAPFYEDTASGTFATAMRAQNISGAEISRTIWDVRQGTSGHYGWGSGKCTPEQLTKYTEAIQQYYGDNFQAADPEAIRDYMLCTGLGIDCSGFAYNVLHHSFMDAGHEEAFVHSLDWADRERTDVFRAGVGAFVGDASRQIPLSDVQPLDFVVVHYEHTTYSHIALILHDEQQRLILAHSSLANTPAGVGTCPLFDENGHLAFQSRFGYSWQHLHDIGRLDFRRLCAIASY